MEKLKNGNTFLEVKRGETQYYAKDVNKLGDCGFYDRPAKRCKKSKRRAKELVVVLDSMV